ncbi:MAG: response regulator transcription factor [Dysgonomonas sp.]|nr:response regulator transcription factor [Dysgonomonas sp.]
MEINNKDISILIVDDEPDIREILQFNLQNEGYNIDLAESAEEAATILSPKHKLILLDVMMGGMSGFKFADQLRREDISTPIIFLTAKNTENDMLTGFSIGGDDYISKPFSIKEVIARVKSILKRTNKPISMEDEKKVLKVDNLIIDFETKTVSVDGKKIELTKTEFNILTLLVENLGKIFSRTDILDKAWKDDGIVLERTVDVHIARLRKKIGNYGDCIINRTGYGYTFQTHNA